MLACRICKNRQLRKFLTLGPTPLANRFLREDQLAQPEPTYPLDVYFCPQCSMVQLGTVVPGEIMFKDYVYVSGTSNTLKSHFEKLAEEVVDSTVLHGESLIVDIGSNDGTLLKCFSRRGYETLGIEPATNVAKIARDDGVETVNSFFSEELALDIAKKKRASVILATNVFAHIDNLKEFVNGVGLLLEDDGTFVIEVPYIVDLLEKLLFDTIYHEHLSYFSVGPLVELFRNFGMKIVDVKRISTHGGSIRVYVTKSSHRHTPSQSVEELLQLEKRLGLDAFDKYAEFSSLVNVLREKLVSMLKQLKAEGNRIVGYGAPAKGNTLLVSCHIGADLLDYIVDESSLKQGLFTPGTHISVKATGHLRQDMPQYALLLAWNYAPEILEREKDFLHRGGRFILPIPHPKVIPE